MSFETTLSDIIAVHDAGLLIHLDELGSLYLLAAQANLQGGCLRFVEDAAQKVNATFATGVA